MNKVTVIGAGLAGSEAAWQLANRGIQVELVEMLELVEMVEHLITKHHKLVQQVQNLNTLLNYLENSIKIKKQQLLSGTQ